VGLEQPAGAPPVQVVYGVARRGETGSRRSRCSSIW
jgi:hypothetical protein